MRIPASIMVPKKQLWRSGHERSANVLGQKLPIRQTVLWAAMGTGGILKLGKLGNRLFLVECDHRGEPLTDKLVYRNLKFINTDLELDLPIRSICGSARDWLAQTEASLVLNLVEDKLPDLELRPQAIGKMMQLLAVPKPASSDFYGVLALNA